MSENTVELRYTQGIGEMETELRRIDTEARRLGDNYRSANDEPGKQIDVHVEGILQAHDLIADLPVNEDGSVTVTDEIREGFKAALKTANVADNASENIRQSAFTLITNRPDRPVSSGPDGFLAKVGEDWSRQHVKASLLDMDDGKTGEKVCSRGAVVRITRPPKTREERIRKHLASACALAVAGENPVDWHVIHHEDGRDGEESGFVVWAAEEWATAEAAKARKKKEAEGKAAAREQLKNDAKADKLAEESALESAALIS